MPIEARSHYCILATDRRSVDVPTSPMNRPIHSAADRRNQLLDLAGELIGERGYANTSVQAIIDAAGVAKGTFYHRSPMQSRGSVPSSSVSVTGRPTIGP